MSILSHRCWQGDQIRQVSVWVSSYFGQFFENYQSSQHFWANISTVHMVEVMQNFYKKMGWATFWATFFHKTGHWHEKHAKVHRQGLKPDFYASSFI
jgi:Cft2 family RNA processing exonuclease